jgi:phosphomannomutase
MKRRDAVLGVLIDGDVDRVMFVYPRIEGDKMFLEEADFNESFAVILEHLLTYMSINAVSTNIASSSIFQDICKKHGINIYSCNPVGFKYQSRDMRRHPDQTIVGIEGNSGGFSVSSFSHEKDGCLAASLAIRMVADSGSFAKNIDQLREKYGKRYIREVNVSTPELPTRKARRAAIIFLTNEFKVGQLFCGKKIVAVDTVDGVKLKFADGCSLLIRASGTEPKFRVVPETKNEKEGSILVEAVKRRLVK